MVGGRSTLSPPCTANTRRQVGTPLSGAPALSANVCLLASRKGDSAKISNRTATPRVDTAMLSELQLVLEPARRELVRAFVREASLAEGVPVSVASLIADDTPRPGWPSAPRDRAASVPASRWCARTGRSGPQSCCTAILDSRTLRHRSPATSGATRVSPAASTESMDGRSAFTAA